MRKFVIFLILSAFLWSGEEEVIARVRSHLLVGDKESAWEEIQTKAFLYPQSQRMIGAYVEVLAALGKENEAISFLQKSGNFFPKELLEEIAWGVIKKGKESSQFMIRLLTLHGAFSTHDTKAVSLILSFLRDSNAFLRAQAVRMACSYRDEILKKEIRRLFEEEKVWRVREEVIIAVGFLKLRDQEAKLKEMIANERTDFYEKALAIESLIQLKDVHIEKKELDLLFQSPHSGFRMLAIALAVYDEIADRKEDVFRLLDDSIAEVRISALQALGLYYRKISSREEINKKIKNCVTDVDKMVSLSAAWVGLLIDSPTGEKGMRKWLFDEDPMMRRYAASALTASGKHGLGLLKEMLLKHTDPYVKINLAIGLIGQRVDVKQAANVLYQFFSKKKELWMWQEDQFFVLLPSTIRHVDEIPQYPEAMDILVQLRLLSYLAVVDDRRGEEAIRHFLQEKCFGITGLASTLLLREGDEKAIDLVKALLVDKDSKVRLQAALVLALFGKDRAVIPILEKFYSTADYELKLKILEGIGQTGEEESFPFLLEAMKEPFLGLKIAAASSLIQCMNR